MDRRWTERRVRERGQALVETALTAMILLLLLAGMVDFGLAFGYRIALSNGSRAGARFGARFPHLPTLIESAVVDALVDTVVLPDDYVHDLYDPIPDPDIRIACSANGDTWSDCSAAQRGHQIRVTVTYDYAPLFVSLLGLDTIEIGSVTRMVVLGPDGPTP